MKPIKISSDLSYINTPEMDNNTFLLFKGKKVIVVDPSFAGDSIINALDNSYKVVGILLTHAHFDHCYDVNKILKVWDCPVYLHKEDKLTYERYHYADLVDSELMKFDKNLHYFSGKELKVDDFNFKISLTPGHTRGSVCYRYDNYVFVGDTLFFNSYGRTDLVGGNGYEMIRSLKYLWTNLKDNDYVCCGHSKCGTFKEIKEYNHVVKSTIE